MKKQTRIIFIISVSFVVLIISSVFYMFYSAYSSIHKSEKFQIIDSFARTNNKITSNTGTVTNLIIYEYEISETDQSGVGQFGIIVYGEKRKGILQVGMTKENNIWAISKAYIAFPTGQSLFGLLQCYECLESSDCGSDCNITELK